MSNAPSFLNLTFDDFRDMARNQNLSRHEKIGFPDSYRAGYEETIFRDIAGKLPAMQEEGSILLDIGCGCSGLADRIIRQGEEKNQTLLMVDSAEMLGLLPDSKAVTKIEGRFPDNAGDLGAWRGKVQSILVYSVMQHIVLYDSLYRFIDQAVGMLAENGRLLLGDIPNISKRTRFFATPQGVRFHRNFTQSDTLPDNPTLRVEADKIDDGIVFGILQRYRNFGLETYLLPQNPDLPMSNRREDILIVRT